MQRVTIKMLESRIDTINSLTSSPMTPWTRQDGKLVANIGNYHLSQAYGGVCVHRMHSEGGGVTTPIFHGHLPKREALDQINAFIAGLQA